MKNENKSTIHDLVKSIDGLYIDREQVPADINDICTLEYMNDEEDLYVSKKEYETEYGNGILKFRLAIQITDMTYFLDKEAYARISVLLIPDYTAWSDDFRKGAAFDNGVEDELLQDPGYKFSVHESITASAAILLAMENVAYDTDDDTPVLKDPKVAEKLLLAAGALETFGALPQFYLNRSINRIGTTGYERLEEMLDIPVKIVYAINRTEVDERIIPKGLNHVVDLTHQGCDDEMYVSQKEYSAEYADGRSVKYRLGIILTDYADMVDEDENEEPYMTIKVAMIVDSSQWGPKFRERAVVTNDLEEAVKENPEYHFTPYEAVCADAYVVFEDETIAYNPDDVIDIFEEDEVKEKLMATAAILDMYGENPMPYLEKTQNKVGTTGVEILDYIIHDEDFIEKANRRQFARFRS